MHQTTTLPGDMREWIETVTGSTVREATRQAGGGRNEGWLIIPDSDDVSTHAQLFLRWDRSDPEQTGDPWSVHREATVYRALSGRGLPVADFLAVHPSEQAILLEAVAGDGRFSMVSDSVRATAIAQDFMQRLAEVHRLDVIEIGLAAPGSTVEDHVHAQLDEIDDLIRFRGGIPTAELALALRWLRAHVPDYSGPAVLVQGDTGPGNFMFDGDRVSAIVDWELAHPGDPMDDLAWISLRSTQEPFPDLPERFHEYEIASGNRIDLDRIRYYRVLAEAKIAAMGHSAHRPGAPADGSGGGDAGARLIFGQLHRRLLVESLGEVLAIHDGEPDDEPQIESGEETEWHGLYGVILAQLRDVIGPRVTDGFAIQRMKGLARVVKYLEAVDRNGRAAAAAELDDLEPLIGTRPATVGSARRRLAEAVQNDAIDLETAYRVLHRSVVRDNELLRSASGALADRHYDPLTRFRRSA